MESLRYDFSTFDVAAAAQCGISLRRAVVDCESMEEATERIVRYLYERFADPETGEPSCALIRFYKTHRLSRLDDGLNSRVRQQ